MGARGGSLFGCYDRIALLHHAAAKYPGSGLFSASLGHHRSRQARTRIGNAGKTRLLSLANTHRVVHVGRMLKQGARLYGLAVQADKRDFLVNTRRQAKGSSSNRECYSASGQIGGR